MDGKHAGHSAGKKTQYFGVGSGFFLIQSSNIRSLITQDGPELKHNECDIKALKPWSTKACIHTGNWKGWALGRCGRNTVPWSYKSFSLTFPDI